MPAVLPEELTAGYTWVEPHERGGEGEELTMSQLDLACESELAHAAESGAESAGQLEPRI